MTRFDDIQARHAKATPGPWETRNETQLIRPGTHAVRAEGDFDWVCSMQVSNCPNFRADAEFIAHCPDDVGWLLDRVKELEAERETGPTPHKCLNDECETVAYGTGYDACPSCGDTSGRDAGQT